MVKTNLLEYKNNIYSQNGEDGVIDKIFQVIGSGRKVCCEFGAWDGLHFSNTRNLILQGWTSVQIEGNKSKFNDLSINYQYNPKVYCLHEYVDSKKNSLSKILKKHNIFELASQMDFLSIDIDGLDFEILKNLQIRPRVVCIEVNAGHFPDSKKHIDNSIAKDNIGQPLGLFTQVAKKKGYKLVAYTGNAFYIKEDIKGLDKLSNRRAYLQFLNALTAEEREWLYLVNLGITPPSYRFNNPLLTRKKLGISRIRGIYLRIINSL